MNDPGLPPDYSQMLARHLVNEELGTEPDPPKHPRAQRLIAGFVVVCGIVSVAYVVASIT